jgi:prolyl-tRNA editing enzyme YbaK/EbsC (Cys-tRNA(Pro) deacylase)
MEPTLSPSARRVQDALRALGFDNTVVEHTQVTRSAAEAAQAIGCAVGQIAKSLVFRGRASGRAILVIASGANRVDERKLAAAAGEAVEKPDAEFVRQATGYAIGGVPPVGHPQPLRAFIDRDLLQYGDIWAAAGTPNAVFRLTPGELARMTGGIVADIVADLAPTRAAPSA